MRWVRETSYKYDFTDASLVEGGLLNQVDLSRVSRHIEI